MSKIAYHRTREWLGKGWVEEWRCREDGTVEMRAGTPSTIKTDPFYKKWRFVNKLVSADKFDHWVDLHYEMRSLIADHYPKG